MTRLEEAREVVRDLLNGLEKSNSSIEECLMRAKRLARLMRDTDAQSWLVFETIGYPEEFDFAEIGACKKYVLASGRLNEKGRYSAVSLPELEAMCEVGQAQLDSLKSTRSSQSIAKDYVAAGATAKLMTDKLRVQKAVSTVFIDNQKHFAAFKSGLHIYATDVFLAIELGDSVQDIFEEARTQVDAFISINCPQAAEQLVAINERMLEGSREAWSEALTSCRRLLVSVSDSVFPAQYDPWIDRSGNQRKVGSEEYKNRLLAFIEGKLASSSSLFLLENEIEHLAARLDAVNQKVSKGVHSDVTQEEAHLAVIQTYIFVGELARLSSRS